MSASTAIPTKWYIPWAQNDSSRVEVPVTTTDSTRASQSLGFPPLTMQPPESGGVPPQGEDFNGGMNQIARVAWWLMQGGGFPYDSTFATNANIAGYPLGAQLPRAALNGFWLNQTDSNQTNPEAVDGTSAGWVPLSAYGAYALASQTGGTVNVYPVNAAYENITITGTLTSALVVQLPAWVKHWSITNSCVVGAYSVTVKTASGTGIVIPANGAPTDVYGDGTNITQVARNIPAATSSTHPIQFGQATGRLLRTTVIYNNGSGTLLASINGGAYSSIGTSGSATFSPLAATSGVDVEVCGGGGGSGGTSTTSSTQYCGSGGATAGSYGRGYYTSGFSGAVLTAGIGGTAGAGGTTGTAGGNGGASSFGSLLTAPGGLGSAAGVLITSTSNLFNGAPAAGLAASGGYVNAVGGAATPAIGLGGALFTGNGGSTPLGMGGVGKSAGAGTAGGGWGAGGGGAGVGSSTTGVAGAAGTAGVIIIREYA